jgi:ATP/ADP translocase
MYDTPDHFTRSAARVLAANFTLSIVYEAYRATAKAGASRHDSVSGFVEQLPLYAVAAVVIALLLGRRRHSATIGLLFCTAVIVISVFYYNPVIMLERQPGIVDWVEDLVFTGLLFAAATQLVNHRRRAHVALRPDAPVPLVGSTSGSSAGA